MEELKIALNKMPKHKKTSMYEVTIYKPSLKNPIDYNKKENITIERLFHEGNLCDFFIKIPKGVEGTIEVREIVFNKSIICKGMQNGIYLNEFISNINKSNQ